MQCMAVIPCMNLYCTGESTIHTQFIFIRTWIRQNSMPETDEETMTTNDHSGIPDTLVVSSNNCLADLLIRSYVWISWWVNYKQTILAVVYFRSAGTLPCGHWSVAKKVYETGEAADNIHTGFFFPRQSTLHIITAARAWWVGKWWVYAPYITNRKPTQPESVDYACMVACMVTVTI